MRILLQHRRSLQYVQTADAWTKSDGKAYNFLHSQKAIDFAHEHNMSDVYVTVKFLGGDPDVSVPVPHRLIQPQA